MNFKKLTVTKFIKTQGMKKDGSGIWERVEVVMADLHSQVETRFVARVQKRVLESGVDIKEGEEYDVGISLNCREYEGKYYNELSIWRMEEAAF